MRSLLSVFLLLVVSFSSSMLSFAQDDDTTQVAAPYSQRFSMSVPTEWVVIQGAELFEDEIFAASDVLMVADSPATVDIIDTEDFDPFSSDSDWGAFVIAVTFAPTDIGMEFTTAAEIMDLLATDLGEDARNIARDSVELRGISGEILTYTMGDGEYFGQLWLMADDDVVVMVIAGANNDLNPALETALATFTYTTFDEEARYNADELGMNFPVGENFAQISLPAGWWSSPFDLDMMVLMPVTRVTFNGSQLDPVLVVISSVSGDEVPRTAEGDVDYQALLQTEWFDSGEVVSLNEWSTDGLQGMAFEGVGIEVALNDAVVVLNSAGYVLDGDGVYYVVQVATHADDDTDYSQLREAILASLVRVEPANQAVTD